MRNQYFSNKHTVKNLKTFCSFQYRVSFDIGNGELLKPWSERNDMNIVFHMRIDYLDILTFNSYTTGGWKTETVKFLLNPMKVGNENILHIEIQTDFIKVFSI